MAELYTDPQGQAPTPPAAPRACPAWVLAAVPAPGGPGCAAGTKYPGSALCLLPCFCPFPPALSAGPSAPSSTSSFLALPSYASPPPGAQGRCGPALDGRAGLECRALVPGPGWGGLGLRKIRGRRLAAVFWKDGGGERLEWNGATVGSGSWSGSGAWQGRRPGGQRGGAAMGLAGSLWLWREVSGRPGRRAGPVGTRHH